MNIVEFVQGQQELFCGALTADTVTWQKESQFAIQAFQKNDFLAKTAIANPTSAQNAIINVAAIGISLNPASKDAYLVPRDGAVCLDISYMGLLRIAQESGAILWGQCKLVYANDTYESNGLDMAPNHKYNAFSNRGDCVGGYCTVKTVGGDYLTDEMSYAEIEDIRKISKAGTSPKGPWVNFWSEMARKTIVKRSYKYWPRAPRLDNAIQALNEEEGIFVEPVMQHTDDELIQSEENKRKQQISNKVSELCDQMGICESMDELKPIFSEAYRMTQGMALQKSVQAIYADQKAKLGG